MQAPPRCVLGIDLGTSSLKCVILDAEGTVRATSDQSYPTASPHPGWAEQDPADWLRALKSVLKTLVEMDPQGMQALQAIGICSAAHIPVLLDDKDDVLRPAILWNDNRSTEEVAYLQTHHLNAIQKTTLNQPGCTWTLPQLMWVRNQEPEAIGKTRSLLSSKDYLVYRLCGRKVMDMGSAAATLMLDDATRCWSEPLVRLSGLTPDAMPEIVNATDVVGHVSEQASSEFGLKAGIPIIAGGMDTTAELVGNGLLSAEGSYLIRMGTAGGIMVVEDHPAALGGVITYPHLKAGSYYRQAGTNTCATALQWMRNQLAFLGPDVDDKISYEALDALAAKVPPGASQLLFHPYLQGERAPYWNADMRASFTGIDINHRWPDFVRSVMEGVAFSLRDCATLFADGQRDSRRAILTGGVTKSPIWSQIIADVFNMELLTIRDGGSAFGVALMASVGGELFGSLEEATRTAIHYDRSFHPIAENVKTYQSRFDAYKGIVIRLHYPAANLADSGELPTVPLQQRG
ncbi:xylulokinase [uncultured Cohaesibacter sp.]|uniref:xylulokinase n=1 Tax=uncultured Cohaesibacter sp. TaxID=1002546 RepID=UPI0029C7D5CF|nr:xylulokinase [uncultured Cohaesibacter sp.]